MGSDNNFGGIAGVMMEVGGRIADNMKADFNYWRNYDDFWNYWNAQNIYNERMLADERAYNSPSSQMQRFVDAGLNPNLIYGQLNNSYYSFNRASTASGSPTPFNLPTQPFSGAQFYAALKQGELIDAQIAESQSRIDVNSARENYFTSQSALNAVRESIDQLKFKSFKNGNYYDELVKGAIQANLLSASKTLGLDLQNQYLSQTFDNRVLQVALQNEILGKQPGYIDALTNKAYSDIVRNNELNQLSRAQIARINVQNDLDNWRSVLAGQSYDWNEQFNPAKLSNIKAQTNLYNKRALYTNRKYKFIPLNFGAGLLQNRANNFINAVKLIPFK